MTAAIQGDFHAHIYANTRTGVQPTARRVTREKNINVCSISGAGHFVFWGNPLRTGEIIRDVYFPNYGIISLLSMVEERSTLGVGIVGKEGMDFLKMPRVRGNARQRQFLRPLDQGSLVSLRCSVTGKTQSSFRTSLIASTRLSSFPARPKNMAICFSCSRPV